MVLAVVLPQQRDRGDLAYLGPDSIWLLQRAWPLATGGRLAVELGTGTGYLAASLAPRYELTIGTEVLRTTAAVAALTFHLNGPSKLCCLLADVAAPLRPRCADFVIANAPWVPAGQRTRRAAR